MPRAHRFGGEWTEEKLRRLEAYLGAYTRIFRKNPRAAFLTTIYVDAFAGTGSRAQGTEGSSALTLFDQDFEEFKKGSARIALETDPSFDRFLFIERRKDSRGSSRSSGKSSRRVRSRSPRKKQTSAFDDGLHRPIGELTAQLFSWIPMVWRWTGARSRFWQGPRP